jgi:hypothetical protein
MSPDSRRTEHLTLLSHQCLVSTVEDSVLRTEKFGLESQEQDDPKRVLFFKPMEGWGLSRTVLQSR